MRRVRSVRGRFINLAILTVTVYWTGTWSPLPAQNGPTGYSGFQSLFSVTESNDSASFSSNGPSPAVESTRPLREATPIAPTRSTSNAENGTRVPSAPVVVGGFDNYSPIAPRKDAARESSPAPEPRLVTTGPTTVSSPLQPGTDPLAPRSTVTTTETDPLFLAKAEPAFDLFAPNTPETDSTVPTETTSPEPTTRGITEVADSPLPSPVDSASLIDIPPVDLDLPAQDNSKGRTDSLFTALRAYRPSASALDSSPIPEDSPAIDPAMGESEPIKTAFLPAVSPDRSSNRSRRPSDSEITPASLITGNAPMEEPRFDPDEEEAVAYSTASPAPGITTNASEDRLERSPAQDRSQPVRIAQNGKTPPSSGALEESSGLLTEPTTDNRIIPPPEDYKLSQKEAELLDKFLDKWEKYGEKIKKVACSFQIVEMDGGLLQKSQNSKKPISHTAGKFRFIAPNKVSYHVEGEFVYDENEKEPKYKKGSGEIKFVCDGKSILQYDFQKRLVSVTPISEEEWDQDLSVDGPIPLFFIAKAESLKKRFYLKIVTPKEKQGEEVWIDAWPRRSEDAQNFQKITITLYLKDLQPYYMRKYHQNGKSYSDIYFEDISINKGLWQIDDKIEFGWKKEIHEPEPEGASEAIRRENER